MAFKFELARELGKTFAEIERDVSEEEMVYWSAILQQRASRSRESWEQLEVLLQFLVALHTPVGKTVKSVREMMPKFEF